MRDQGEGGLWGVSCGEKAKEEEKLERERARETEGEAEGGEAGTRTTWGRDDGGEVRVQDTMVKIENDIEE